VSDPHAAVDPDRRVSLDDQIDTGIPAAGRGRVGDHADIDAALRCAGESLGDPRTRRKAVSADQDLALGAVYRIRRERIAVFLRREAGGDRRAGRDLAHPGL
jgi:hypothetical protein